MRLNPEQIEGIRQIVAEQAGADATVRLFGSRLDERARGGDVDLLAEVPRPLDDPAALAARIAGHVGCLIEGRKANAALHAPNLHELRIREVAWGKGIVL